MKIYGKPIFIRRVLIHILLSPTEWWVGFSYDQERRILLFMFIPMLGLVLNFGRKVK